MGWYQQSEIQEIGQQGCNQATNPTICNKLQSHKSSFQAWKCVSFGCSLLALMLLLSKWYEVTTDLHILSSIDQLLMQHQAGSSNITSLTWPPVPLEQLLPPVNETLVASSSGPGLPSQSGPFGMESLDNNRTMLMSHLHITLSRELNGNQLLRQEVDAFIGE